MAETQEAYLERMRREMTDKFEGVDADATSTVQFELDVLRQSGIATFVHCHGTGALKCRTTFQALGVSGRRETVYDAGWQHLAPTEFSERLASLTSRYRYHWEKHSVSLAQFGSKYRWMTPEKWNEWREVAGQIEDEVRAIAERLASKYDTILSWQRRRFGATATEAWQALKDADPDVATPLVQFREMVIREAAEKLPGRNELVDRIYFTYSTVIITTGADVLEDQTRKERLEHLRTRERELTRTLELEADVNRRLLMEHERTAIRKERAMQEAILQHAREELERMGSPLQQVLDSVESTLHGAMVKMADAIRKHGYPRRQTVDALHAAIQQYRALSLTEDTRLDAELSALELALQPRVASATNRDEPTRDKGAITNAILAIVDATKEAAHRVAADLEDSKGGRIDL